MSAVIRLALQKSGRLFDDSLRLLSECGIELESGRTSLKNRATNFPIELLFLRDDDIPAYIADGIADVGIVGLNTLYEKRAPLALVEKLGFSRCRLSIAIPKADEYRGLPDLEGKRIATSHPNILGEFLKNEGVSAEIHVLSGSVEIAPSIGLADAICDLVSTGSTLASNGLKEVETVFRSEAVLVARESLSEDVSPLLAKLRLRLNAVRQARSNKYIMLNAPNESLQKIADVIPGAKSPSILPLSIPGWSSLHSVVKEDDFWEVIENLKALGAQGILVIPIGKMIA